MAEAVAGLSLAANILQMVEYGTVFVKTAWKIHSAQTDNEIVKDFKHLQYLAEGVDGVLRSLEQEINVASSTPVASENEDPELARLADECRKVTVEILRFVGQTGDQKSWKKRMHKAVKEAFQLTWGQVQLAKLQARLDGLRSHLTLRLVHSLRNLAAASCETQDAILRKIVQESARNDYKVEEALGIGLGTASVDLISKKIDEKLAGRQSAEIKESLRLDILGVLSDPGRVFETTDDIGPRTFKVSPPREQTLKEKLLDDLSYPDMLLRERSVFKASETTFQWIFERKRRADRPWASFRAWLEYPGKQLYWMTGKPGSGKSTLMKFVSQPPGDEPELRTGNPRREPRCLPFLKRWAGNHPLIIASYYFWTIGSPMQRSKEGMLRTLLHGILRQVAPETMASIMPESWEALHLFDEDLKAYSEDSLQTLLSRVFRNLCPSVRICLFIDGLDEFEGQHDDLVSHLRNALKTHPIKLCVSSRQWQIFEDRFHDTPSLRLQDLTLPDMMKYVQSELYTGSAFAQLRERDPSFSDKLNENVALRSNGVFLWLTLVVKSLRKGITAGDRISDLQMRLDQLPQDLEALFERILDELDPEYLGHSIHYFKLMEARRKIGAPNVMVFCYADEEDETFGINCPISELDRKTYDSRRDYLKRRLNSRCMGLLEITEPKRSSISGPAKVFLHASQSRVNYLHRTVGDYMSRGEVRDRLNCRAGRVIEQGDDLHLRLCSSELAFFKSSPSALQLESLDSHIMSPADVPARNCLRHAAQVQKPSLQSMLLLVETLDNLYPVYYKSYDTKHAAQPRDKFGSIPVGASRGTVGPAFIMHAIECGALEYVRVKAHRQSSKSTHKFWRKISSAKRSPGGIPKVASGMWSGLEWMLAVAVQSPSPSPALVELLLERGANPQYGDHSQRLFIWKLALMAYMHKLRKKSQGKEEREQIVALMIKYGAPIETSVIVQAYQELARWHNMAGKDDLFCSTIENQLKIMKATA